MYTMDDINSNREIWTYALRYDNLPQTEGQLWAKDGDSAGMCCLGVAAMKLEKQLGLLRQEKKFSAGDGTWFTAVAFAHPDDKISPINDSHRYDSAYLGKSTRAALGLSRRSQSILVSLNDNHVPFTAIADVVDLLPIEEAD